MASIGTSFYVSDNTGAKKLVCLKNLSRKTTKVKLGDLIVGVIKVASPKGVVKKSDIIYAIVIRTKSSFRYNDGPRVRFQDNAVVLVDKKYNPLGTRIFGVVSKLIKMKQNSKLSSLATELV